VSVVDGVLGAIVLFAVIFAVLMIILSILNTLSDLAFMTAFNVYANDAEEYNYCLGALYQYNVFNQLEVIKNLPIHGWLAAKE
jgi:hypothetical protein